MKQDLDGVRTANGDSFTKTRLISKATKINLL